jgi:small subunit ribosomal protein S20
MKQNERNRARNRTRKSMVKSTTRKFLDAIRAGDLETAQKAHVVVQKQLDQVGAKGTLHRNTVARRKSRLAKRLNAALAASNS